MLAELGQSRERQQADSKIISHLRLILFKEKESSKALLHTVAKKRKKKKKAGTLQHTHIQTRANKNNGKAPSVKVWHERRLGGQGDVICSTCAEST